METSPYIRSIEPSLIDSLYLISELIVSKSSVLDLGAGVGALGNYLARTKECNVIGVEKYSSLPLDALNGYIDFLCADLESANWAEIFKDQEFNYIVLADVIEHLRDPNEILKQIPSIMTKDGHLLLSVPNIGHAGVIAGLLSGQFNYSDNGLLDTTHVRFFTRTSLCKLLERHGFEILSITPLRKDIHETEFKEFYLDAQAPALVRALLAQPDALTYQFIVDAVYNPDTAGKENKRTGEITTLVNQLSFGSQLFWKSLDEQYASIRSISTSGVIGKERQSIFFNFPQIDVPPSNLRFDLSDRPGLINIYNMQLIAANGNILWKWNGNFDYLASLQTAGIHIIPTDIKNSILLLGDDSQIELQIPEGVLRQLNKGTRFVVELDWPMSADFTVALAWLAEGKQLSNQLKVENESLRQENNLLNKKILEISAELAETTIGIATLEKNRLDILTSYSWRITKPWRWIGSRIFNLMRTCQAGLDKLNVGIKSEKRNLLSDGVTGNLELPSDDVGTQRNIANVSGWIFSTVDPVLTVYATVNGSSEQMLAYGYDRPDVHKVYPNEFNSIQSGFSGIVSWERTLNNKVKLDVWAECQSGARIHCFSRSIHCHGVSNKIHRFGFTYRFIKVVTRKAWYAYRAGRLHMSPSAWWLALRRNYIWMSVEARNQNNFYPVGIPPLIEDPYEKWIQTNRITSKLEVLMKSDANILESNGGVKISIVVPVYNTPLNFLNEMFESVAKQIYKNWELILVDDASTLPHVRESLTKLSELDPRIHTKFRTTNGHISEATNDGFKEATGEFIALLDHDDTLPQDALLHVAEFIAQQPDVDWIYTDEDKIDATGLRYDPQFKGEWNPEMAITHNYTHHLSVIRKAIIDKVGGMRKGFEGAQDLDLFLRVAEETGPTKIRHIPHIAYHWRSHDESTASQGTQKTYVFDSAREAIHEALIRRNLKAEPFLPAIAQKHGMCLNQLRWKNVLGLGREVTIIIPTKDRIDLLKRCISSIYKTCDKRFVKILIMDDRSSDVASLKYFKELENNNYLNCKVIRPKRFDGTFNYARLINEAAEQVDTPYLLQLNNDVEATEPGWLEDMIGWLTVDGVGVVGARLLYPDQTVQHAGVVIGPHGGLADHQFHQLQNIDVGYLALPHAARDVSAVTGACLLTSVDLFKKMSGFDEINFAVEYNDVDFCLRVIESGKRVVYTPQATLIHLTSATRGKSFNPEEHINFIKKYYLFKDAFYSNSIRQDSMWMTVNGEHYEHVNRVKKIRILIISHALSLTGAPIVAYEFARYFAKVMGFEVTVLALQDGLVHQWYDELGIKVKVISELIDINMMSEISIKVSLERIGNLINIYDEFDLVVCNTLTTFWGVILANQLNVPSIWHIHESLGVERYAATFADPTVGNMVVTAFKNANRVVFQSNATRAVYGEFEAGGNLTTIPGGLPLLRIEEFRLTNTKSVLRNKYHIQEDSYIVVLIGTTCERKGQAVFLDAISQISSYPIPANVTFLMVGAIDGPYLEGLKEKISRLNVKNVHLVAETIDIYDYYGLSDLFVCASFEESFPMVVLLAMAFELPIVSTNVFGIPEIVSDKQEALLIPPGDPKLMAKALCQIINDQDMAQVMVAKAYAKVNRLFDSNKLHSRHSDIARKVMMEDAITAKH